MSRSKHFKAFWLPLALILVGLLVLAGLPAPRAEAGPTLPPRDTPTPVPPRDDEDDDDRPVGAYIELRVPGAPAAAWAVVEWQDNTGGWHAVEGWSGSLDEKGNQRWWVAAQDFDTGPFRWVVTQGQGGPAWGISQIFSLPAAAGETTQVSVSPL